MDGRRGWMWVTLAVSGLWVGCDKTAERPANPSASDREGRSELLRDLVASREKAPDPEAMRELAAGEGQEPSSVSPEPLGQGGSGGPEPTGHLQGRVEWVGDDELLIRDSGGVERDLAVNPRTRLLMKGEEVELREVRKGDEVRVSYDEGRGGWVARQVEVVLPKAEEPASGAPAPPPR